MTYSEIEKVVATHPYMELPLIASDEEGNQLVITDGYRDIVEDGEIVKEMHYYRVFTYKGQTVTAMLYYKNGMVLIDTSM